MKKVLTVLLVLTLVVAVAGCGSVAKQPETKQPEPAKQEAKYKDGMYYAEEAAFAKGWKYAVTLTVKDGKITAADWNGVNIAGGPDKDALSKAGKYPIVANGGAKADWHVQAEKVEAYLVQTQDPAKINYKNADGNTDDIAGATIKVKPFFDLAAKALTNGPIAKGAYKDGFYYAQEAAFEKGFKYMAHIAVVNGTIVAVDWNGIAEEKDAPDKDTLSKSGQYGMKEKGKALAEWHEEAEKVEAYLIKTQDPAKITYKNEDGNTDDIAGATLKVKPFFTLAQEALKAAK